MPRSEKVVELDEEVIVDTDESTGKVKAKAFLNYSIPLAGGKHLRSQKGFPIFQNPQFPNKTEDILVALAEKNGGSVEVMLRARVVINQSQSASDFDLDTIELPETDAE